MSTSPDMASSTTTTTSGPQTAGVTDHNGATSQSSSTTTTQDSVAAQNASTQARDLKFNVLKMDRTERVALLGGPKVKILVNTGEFRSTPPLEFVFEKRMLLAFRTADAKPLVFENDKVKISVACHGKSAQLIHPDNEYVDEDIVRLVFRILYTWMVVQCRSRACITPLFDRFDELRNFELNVCFLKVIDELGIRDAHTRVKACLRKQIRSLDWDEAHMLAVFRTFNNDTVYFKWVVSQMARSIILKAPMQESALNFLYIHYGVITTMARMMLLDDSGILFAQREFGRNTSIGHKLKYDSRVLYYLQMTNKVPLSAPQKAACQAVDAWAEARRQAVAAGQDIKLGFPEIMEFRAIGRKAEAEAEAAPETQESLDAEAEAAKAAIDATQAEIDAKARAETIAANDAAIQAALEVRTARIKADNKARFGTRVPALNDWAKARWAAENAGQEVTTGKEAIAEIKALIAKADAEFLKAQAATATKAATNTQASTEAQAATDA